MIRFAAATDSGRAIVGEGRLAGKVALITGAASGIGRACALRFAEEGADIVIADRDPRRGAEAVAEVRAASNGRVLFVEVDVASEDSIEAMADHAVAEFGRIDTAVAAAGISSAGYVSGQVRPREIDRASRHLLNLDLGAWRTVLDVNLTGVWLTNRAVARRMIRGNHAGSIVNLASTAARVALPGAGDYCVSKAGVAMLTHVLALELVEHKIRVNAIGPGFIETPMTAAMNADPEGRSRMIDMTPMGRLGSVLEMANCALYLACDESSFTTGQTLYPNGGWYVG